ncbi:MAG: hypothetical protein WB816_16535 [Methylocystis sp.]
MDKVNKWALAAVVILVGYYLWNFFVNSRYQALCNVNYWAATEAQVDSCKDVRTQLDDRR